MSAAPVWRTAPRLILLVCAALGRLAWYDLIARQDFKRIHAHVRRQPVARRRTPPPPHATADIVWAVEEACVWYVKRAYCLQRSAVTTWMLRRAGIRAEMVIGFRPVPIESHAWVEVDGRIVNDRPQYQKFFRVIDRL